MRDKIAVIVKIIIDDDGKKEKLGINKLFK